jgi:hypothetical protein
MAHSRELAEATDDIEALLNDPAHAATTFGVEFDSVGSLQNRAEEVAYLLGHEEGRTGRTMNWSKRLLDWARKRKMPSVQKSYEDGKEDGAK